MLCPIDYWVCDSLMVEILVRNQSNLISQSGGVIDCSNMLKIGSDNMCSTEMGYYAKISGFLCY